MDQSEATNAFNLYAGKKGSLTTQEFKDALAALGLNPSGTSGGGDLNAFLSAASSAKGPTDSDNDKLKVAITVFDKAGMGFIAAEEFVKQAKILGDPLNEVEAQAMLALAKDGKIKTTDLFNELSN